LMAEFTVSVMKEDSPTTTRKEVPPRGFTSNSCQGM
jgi:hypothetical protein